MFKIFKEVTQWECDYNVPNHTYLVNPKNKVIAYSTEKNNQIINLKIPFDFDKRYRKFVEVKHSKLSDLIPKDYKEEKQEKPKNNPTDNIRVFKVKSKEKEYTVEYNILGNYYTCNCIGFGYRRRCKHTDAVEKTVKNQ